MTLHTSYTSRMHSQAPPAPSLNLLPTPYYLALFEPLPIPPIIQPQFNPSLMLPPLPPPLPPPWTAVGRLRND